MMATCGSLFSWVYTLPPTNIWVPAETIMSTNSFILSSIAGFLKALIFVIVFAILYKGIPNRGIRKGVNNGGLVCGNLSGTITMLIYMTINVIVVIYWIAQALVHNVIAGVIVAYFYKGN
jgi:hypothetical protein